MGWFQRWRNRNIPFGNIIEGVSSIQQACPNCDAVQTKENDGLRVGLFVAGIDVGRVLERIHCEKCKQPFKGIRP